MVLLSASGFAQPYRSYFGNEYTKWSVFSAVIDADYTMECASRPDATIVLDSVTYYKLAVFKIMFPDTWSINVNDSYFDRYFLASNHYLREDQTTGRLYLRTSSDTEEFIVSDMSLKVGDSYGFMTVTTTHCHFLGSVWFTMMIFRMPWWTACIMPMD